MIHQSWRRFSELDLDQEGGLPTRHGQGSESFQDGYPWSIIMAIQIVMDHNGDTRHYFDPNDADALAKAEERFKELTGQGFTAAVRITSGEVAKISSFKPMVEQTFLVLSAIILETKSFARRPYGDQIVEILVHHR